MAGNKSSQRKGKQRRRPPTFMPLIFRQSDTESQNLKLIPYTSLEQFRNGTADIVAWYNLYVRLTVGYFLARDWYEKDTQDQMGVARSHCIAIREAHMASGKTTWIASDAQIEGMRLGLEATDEMQDATTRRQQMPAHVEAERLTNIYLKQDMETP